MMDSWFRQPRFDASLPATDPDRYVDASTIPYLVFPSTFHQIQGTGRMGDFGYAINLTTGDPTGFIVADVGPANHSLGEISIAMANELGGHEANPRNGSGAPSGPFAYVVFQLRQRKTLPIGGAFRMARSRRARSSC